MRRNAPATAASGYDAQLLIAAVDAMPCGFSVWNERFKLELFNQRFIDMFGLSEEKVVPGITLYKICELTIAEGRGAGLPLGVLYNSLKGRLERQKEHQRPGRLEQVVGDMIIRTSIARHPDIGWMVTHEDISEDVRQRRTELETKQQLLTQSTWFERAINSMSQGLCAFDGDKRLIICNRAYAEIYGLPEKLTAPGTRFEDILEYRIKKGLIPDGETPQSHRAKRMELVESETSERKFIEFENNRFIYILKNPMPGGGWIGVIQDVTEEQQKEELISERSRDLKLQNLRFEAAVKNMAQGLVMFDAERRLVICNDQYINLYNLPKKLARPGTRFAEIAAHQVRMGMVPDGCEDDFLQHIDRLIKDGGGKKTILEMANGSHVSVNYQPVGDGGWVSTHEDVTERQLNEARIRYMARHDALTDLPNRTCFNEEMERSQSRISRGDKLALLCIDLDKFKRINDTYGHGVGDEVLRRVASRLKNGKREHEIIARMGGDEFMLLAWPVNSAEDVGRIAQRILHDLGRPILIDGREFMISTSIGIAMAPEDGKDGATLMKHADMALYRAKGEGRRSYRFFKKGMDEAIQQRHKLGADLREALAQNQFKLSYQPVLELASNRVSCCEANLRWEHPERGILLPEQFIPVAEETGFIARLGAWALGEACEAARDWPEGVRLALKLTSSQIICPRAAENIASILKATGFDPARLELAVSEKTLAKKTKAKLGVLQQLRSMGVRIAMDRFGAGFSSLGNLGAFSFDKINIDQALMNEIELSRQNREIVKAIISLGGALGIVTSASGIEYEAQLDIVSEYGCTEVQGHLFSPAMPASSIVELLRTVEMRAAQDAGFAPASQLIG
ncbi:diguanylate cyclase/phosphodiesterase (GGDEF & EAL domains) with PAS/PAC sensor(s) [hydrothermal vent metagenome]|uniref:Diguanylate cyclase/phosphodiesterase (GGDEF & EAL domains) with PAS/PAC sensor(S) n=1 Tax=hydrothermal vent metagenome TaxID=652676 RepID=A0A3B0TKB1_9ZZZZ